MRILVSVVLIVLGFAGDALAQSCASTQGQLEYCKALTNAVRFGFPRYTTALLPTCNTNNKGAVAYDTTANLVKYCDGSSWTSVGAGGGVSGLTAGTIPKAASATSLSNSQLLDDGSIITLPSTLGSELMPALTGASGVNWTFAGTYTTPLASTIEKAGAGTDTITPTAATAIVAGTTYKVVIVTSAFTAGSATYTVGGVTGTSLSTATTTTDYIRATTTGNFILTPTDAARFVISSVSVKALTATTGRLFVSGPSSFYSPLTIANGATVTNGQLLLPAGTAANPSLALGGEQTGPYLASAGAFGISVAGSKRFELNSTTATFYGITRPSATGTYPLGATATRWSVGYFGGQTLTTTVTPLWDGAVAWNDSGTSHRLIKGVITDTASAASSAAIEILGGAAGTSNLMNLSKAGTLVIGANGYFGMSGKGFINSPATTEWDVLNSALTANAGLRFARVVEVNTTTKAPSATENGEVYTNTGDGDGSTVTLLNDPTIGSQYCVIVDAAQTVTVAPSAGETIVQAGTAYSTSCTNNTAGSTACFIAGTGGAGARWFFLSAVGTWTCS